MSNFEPLATSSAGVPADLERFKKLDSDEHLGGWKYTDSHFWEWLASERVRPSTIAILKAGVATLSTAPKPEGGAAQGVEELRAALQGVRGWLQSAPLESGYCCCGNMMEDHNIGSGHSPVDDLSYSAQQQIEMIDAALAARGARQSGAAEELAAEGEG